MSYNIDYLNWKGEWTSTTQATGINDDSLIILIKILNGSRGRVYKGDDWLGKFQGKNLNHRMVNRNNIFLSLYRYITNLFRRH